MRITSAVGFDSGGVEKIRAFDRHNNMRIIDPGFKPYCFVRAEKYNETKFALEVAGLPFDYTVDKTDAVVFGKSEPCAIIETPISRNIHTFWKNAPDIRKVLREAGIEVFEGDIPPERRWMIDRNVYPQDDPDVMYWDVEADGRAGFPEPRDPKGRLISMAAVDGKTGEEFFFCDDSEEALVHEFLKLARKYPLWIGYNSKKWDLPYVRNRLKVLDIRYPFYYHQHLDMMTMYANSEFGIYSSHKLDDVAKRELKVGKSFNIGAIGGTKALWEMFKHDRDKLREYNVQDTMLLKQLNDKLHLLEMRVMTAELAGILLKDTEYVSRIVDTRIMRRFFGQSPRKVLRCRKHGMDRGDRYAGALILDSPRDLRKWVAGYDFKSLYPSVMIVWNMGADTISDIGDILSANARFLSSPTSEVADELRKLKTLRTEYKAIMNQYKEDSPDWLRWHMMQDTVKLITNSSYGAYGEENSRLYHREVVESITMTGQAIMRLSMRLASMFGLETLHGHTDGLLMSLPVTSGDAAKEFCVKLEKKMNELLKRELMKEYHVPEWRYSTEADPYGILFETSTIYEKIFFPGTKTGYVGWKYSREKSSFRETMTSEGFQDKMSIVGMQLKKYTTSKFLRDLQYAVLAVLEKADSISEVTDEVRDVCIDIRRNLFAGKLDDNLVQRTGVHQAIARYKTNTVQRRLAQQLDALGLFRVGDVIDYVIAAFDGKLNVQAVIPGGEYPVIHKSGYEYYENMMLDGVEAMIGIRPNIQDTVLDRYLYGGAR